MQDDKRKICSSTDSGRSSISSSQTSNCEDFNVKHCAGKGHGFKQIEKTTSSTEIPCSHLSVKSVGDMDIYTDVTLIPKSTEYVRLGTNTKSSKQMSRRLTTRCKTQKPTNTKKCSVNSDTRQGVKSVNTVRRKTDQDSERTSVDEANSPPSSVTCSRIATSYVATNVQMSLAKESNPVSLVLCDTTIACETLCSQQRRSSGQNVEPTRADTGIGECDHPQDQSKPNATSPVERIGRLSQEKKDKSAQSFDFTTVTDLRKSKGHSCKIHTVASVNQITNHRKTTRHSDSEQELDSQSIRKQCALSNLEDNQQFVVSDCNNRPKNIHQTADPVLNRMSHFDRTSEIYSTSSSPTRSSIRHNGNDGFVIRRTQNSLSRSSTTFGSNVKSLLPTRAFAPQSLGTLFTPNISYLYHLRNEENSFPRKVLYSSSHVPDTLTFSASCICVPSSDSTTVLINRPLCWWLPEIGYNAHGHSNVEMNEQGIMTDASSFNSTSSALLLPDSASLTPMPDSTTLTVMTDKTDLIKQANTQTEEAYESKIDNMPNVNTKENGPLDGRCSTPMSDTHVSTSLKHPNKYSTHPRQHTSECDGKGGDSVYSVSRQACESSEVASDLFNSVANSACASITDPITTQLTQPTESLLGPNCAKTTHTSTAAFRNVLVNSELPRLQINVDCHPFMHNTVTQGDQLYNYAARSGPSSADFVYFYNSDGHLFAVPTSALFYPVHSLQTSSISDLSGLSEIQPANFGLKRTPLVNLSTAGLLQASLPLSQNPQLRADRSDGIDATLTPTQLVFPGNMPTVCASHVSPLTLSTNVHPPQSIATPFCNPTLSTPHPEQPSHILLHPTSFVLPNSYEQSNNFSPVMPRSGGIGNGQQLNLLSLSRPDNPNGALGRVGSISLVSAPNHSSTKTPDTIKLPRMNKELSGLLGHAKPNMLTSSIISSSILGDKRQTSHGEESYRSVTNRQKKHSSKTNLYIRGLPSMFTEEQLHTLAPDKELIRSVKLISGSEGEMYGFIDFTSNAAARNALVHIKSTNRDLYVNFAYESEKDPQNVYITNIPETWTAGNVEDLKKIFQPYGQIATAIVMTKRSNNFCTGAGFVRFVRTEDAQKAIEGIRSSQVVLDEAKGPLEVKLADRQKPSEDDQTSLTKIRQVRRPNDTVTFVNNDTRGERTQDQHTLKFIPHKSATQCLLPGDMIARVLEQGQNQSGSLVKSVYSTSGVGLLPTPLLQQLPCPNPASLSGPSELTSIPFLNHSMLLQNQLNYLGLQLPLVPNNGSLSSTTIPVYEQRSPTSLISTPRLHRPIGSLTHNQQSPSSVGMFGRHNGLIQLGKSTEDIPYAAKMGAVSAGYNAQSQAHLWGDALNGANSWMGTSIIPGMFASM